MGKHMSENTDHCNSTTINETASLEESSTFSLVLGGPLFRLFHRARLTDDQLELLQRRIIIMSLLSWLPLCLLAAYEGELLHGSVAVPFLMDIEVHVKFLVAMPLLIAAELLVHRRMRFLVKQFLERNLIPENAMAKFNAAISSALRLRNSVVAEILLIAVVYIVGILIIWRHYTALETATWYAVPSVEGLKFSLAGTWYSYVSLPFIQFLILRWYFRLFIWARFLWQVSRIKLGLVPTHPDRAGGLGFLARTVYAFSLIALAHGAMVAGQLASKIFHLGAELTDFRMEVVFLVAFICCILVGPLLVFASQLAESKRTGGREYDALAQRYVREFDYKWLRGGATADEQLVGSGDIQSLADLGNSLEVVRSMRLVPVTKEVVLQLAIVTIAPITPLVLTMVPFEELLKKLFGILF